MSRAAAKQAFSRALSRQGGRRPPRLAETGRRAARARRAAVPVDRQQGGPGRHRRVQGRGGDRRRRRRRADPGERRRRGRRGQAGQRAAGETRRGRGTESARNKSLRLGPIGFGIGEGKCDTCCAQARGGERGLPRKGGRLRRYRASEADAATWTERGGGNADDGRNARPARTNWLKGQAVRNGHERNEQ